VEPEAVRKPLEGLAVAGKIIDFRKTGCDYGIHPIGFG
jgi:hypothetical protein